MRNLVCAAQRAKASQLLSVCPSHRWHCPVLLVAKLPGELENRPLRN